MAAGQVPPRTSLLAERECCQVLHLCSSLSRAWLTLSPPFALRRQRRQILQKRYFLKDGCVRSHPSLYSTPFPSLPLFLKGMLHLFCCAKLYDARVQSRWRHTQRSLFGHCPPPGATLLPSARGVGEALRNRPRGRSPASHRPPRPWRRRRHPRSGKGCRWCVFYFPATLCVEEVDFDGRPR